MFRKPISQNNKQQKEWGQISYKAIIWKKRKKINNRIILLLMVKSCQICLPCIHNKGPSSQSYGFSGSHVWMWELDYKESRTPKNWCFWSVVLEKTLDNPLDCKEIQPVRSKGYQSWMFFGRTDAKAETPVLWPPHVKSWLILKDPDVGKDWGQEE